ncbi:MAG: hypothetical protein AB7E55_31500, partial [Pigmentiphaga sp.]
MQEFITYWLPRLFLCGVVLALVWAALLLVAHAWKHAWNWIDDSDGVGSCNPIIRRIMRARGLEFKDVYGRGLAGGFR